MYISIIGQDESNLEYADLAKHLGKAQLEFADIYQDFSLLKTSDFIIVDVNGITTGVLQQCIDKLISFNLLERAIIILSHEESHLIGALLAKGAKDVFLKPIHTEELAAKLTGFNNILRHPIFLNSRYGLSLKQQKIFELLKAQRSSGVTRSDVLEAVWPQQQVTEKSVDVHIYNLRKSLTPFDMKIEHQSNRWYLVG